MSSEELGIAEAIVILHTGCPHKPGFKVEESKEVQQFLFLGLFDACLSG